MKSSFNDEVERMLQENIFDNMASAAWTGAKAVGTGLKTVGQAAYGLSGAREAMNQLGSAAGQLKTAAMGTGSSQQAKAPASTDQTPDTSRPLKSIANVDNKIKNAVTASSLTPADKTAFQSQFSAIVKSMGPTVTDQQLMALVAASLSQK